MKPNKQTDKQTDGYESDAERAFWTQAPWIQELREVLMTVYDPPPEDEIEQRPAQPDLSLIGGAYREAADD
jgi:hypothetical protein